MRQAFVDQLHPRFRSKLEENSWFRQIITAIEGETGPEWHELIGQFKILCRLKKPAVEAAIPRIYPIIASMPKHEKKIKDACLQLAGQYVAIIVRSELNGKNTGTKNRVSSLFTRAEVFDYAGSDARPRQVRGSYKRSHRVDELGDEFIAALDRSHPPEQAKQFDHELDRL